MKLKGNKPPKVLGIVPARANSKGLPGKNLKTLKGKPLLWYAIHPAACSGVFDRIILSSNDNAAIEIGRQLGAEIPFVRPEQHSKDHSSDYDVVRHTIDWLYDHEKYTPDLVVLLRCTTPLKKSSDFPRIVSKFQNDLVDSVRTVTKVDGVHHPYWMFRSNESGHLTPLISESSVEKYYQRQMLPPVYRLNGLVDAFRLRNVQDGGLYGEKVALDEIESSRAIDIDTSDDLLKAEFIINHYDYIYDQ